MRIVGGTMRGRPLSGPKQGDNSVRPTSDRARESLFNILASHWPEKLEGARVADLFAGTGALGVEALSRGASFVLFVEMAAKSRGMIRANIETLGLQGVTKLFRRDATDLGPIGTMEPFDLVFMDPPYGKTLGEGALRALHDGQWLRPDALIVLEEASDAAFSCPDPYSVEQQRPVGQSTLRFLRLAQGAQGLSQ